MNAGPTPTPRPAPPTISANKMRTDPHRERRRGRAIHKCAPPAPPCTCPAASCTCPRPSRRHPNAMARPVIQQHQLRTTLAGPPLRPAPGVSRRSRIFKKKTVVYQADITGYRRIRVVSGSYQPNISSKTLYQGLADISLIYQADTMVVRRDDRLEDLIARPPPTAPHRTGGPEVAVRTVATGQVGRLSGSL